jgi:hypothetical protein
MPYGIALPSSTSGKSWALTATGSPAGRHSRLAFLNSPPVPSSWYRQVTAYAVVSKLASAAEYESVLLAGWMPHRLIEQFKRRMVALYRSRSCTWTTGPHPRLSSIFWAAGIGGAASHTFRSRMQLPG